MRESLEQSTDFEFENSRKYMDRYGSFELDSDVLSERKRVMATARGYLARRLTQICPKSPGVPTAAPRRKHLGQKVVDVQIPTLGSTAAAALRQGGEQRPINHETSFELGLFMFIGRARDRLR